MIQPDNKRQRTLANFVPRTPRTGIPFVHQERNNWCWAACAEMVIRGVAGKAIDKCDIADFLFERSDCCQPGRCDERCQVADVEKIFDEWELDAPPTPGRISRPALRQAVAGQHRAVQLAFDNGGLSGHVILVVAHAHGKFFRAHDPARAYPTPTVPYGELRRGYGFGAWTHTWPDIKKRP